MNDVVRSTELLTCFTFAFESVSRVEEGLGVLLVVGFGAFADEVFETLEFCEDGGLVIGISLVGAWMCTTSLRMASGSGLEERERPLLLLLDMEVQRTGRFGASFWLLTAGDGVATSTGFGDISEGFSTIVWLATLEVAFFLRFNISMTSIFETRIMSPVLIGFCLLITTLVGLFDPAVAVVLGWGGRQLRGALVKVDVGLGGGTTCIV